MHSDESSFGWVSADEEERSDIENEVKDSTNNCTMVKLEKNPSDDEKRYNLVSPSAKYRNVEQDHFIDKSEDNEKWILDQHVKNKELNIMQNVGKCEISADEDIWLVQCPQNIDINSLVGLNFLQKDKKKFKLGNSSYECVSSSQQNRQNKLSLLMPRTEIKGDYKMNTFVLNGVYFIREKVNSVDDLEVCEQPTEKVPFPANLKKRHPLLGHNYKHLLKIPNSVKEKLRSPVNKIRKIKKFKESSAESEVITEKVKRKRKAECLDESLEPPQKMKKENVNMWTSELSIEKSLFELLPDKSNRKKNKK